MNIEYEITILSENVRILLELMAAQDPFNYYEALDENLFGHNIRICRFCSVSSKESEGLTHDSSCKWASVQDLVNLRKAQNEI